MLVNSYQITLWDIPHDDNNEISLCQLAFSFVSRYALWWETDFISLWGYSPSQAQDTSLLRILGHTQLDTQTVRFVWTICQLVTEAATYKTHNKDKRQAAIPSAVFEPAIPASVWSQTKALDRRPPESAWN